MTDDATAPGAAPLPAPGWYADPWYSSQHRYWDGRRWTADVFAHAVGGAAPAALAVPPGYGPPPTVPADPPPPAPAWGTLAAALPPEAPAVEVIAGGPPPSTGSRTWKVVAAVVVGGLLVGALGYAALRDQTRGTRSAAGSTTAPTRPTPTPTPTPAPSSPSPAPQPTSPGGAHAALLEALVVRQQDVPDTVAVAPIPGGTQVDGQVTLDLCAGPYPSEALRLERLQTAVFDPADGAATFSTEAVLYRSPAATAQAFREIRSVVESCPGTPVTNAITGTTSTYTFGADPSTSWPRTAGVDRQAYAFTTTDTDGTTKDAVAVYLKRGPILLGLYFLDPKGPQTPVEGKSTIPGIVKVFEERLLKPGAGVSGGSGVTA